ncbi:MAG: flagellar biosynthesis protein [Bacillota bacterium]|jgi:flagellar biosynthesis protein|nr:flagellar biosynthesis protein [Bacillota bacterium]MDK2882735.1 flagellar biosynthesis protein [Bacillota bacterium]MDK2960564.1 flagellar biosynthesis protein [Bacillota bacterium]
MSEKIKSAAALSYDPSRNNAPRVVAGGRGAIAEQILKRARAAGVPIYEDPELALALAGLEVGEEIPPELYQVVAAVIAWVYELEEKELPPGRRILR